LTDEVADDDRACERRREEKMHGVREAGRRRSVAFRRKKEVVEDVWRRRQRWIKRRGVGLMQERSAEMMGKTKWTGGREGIRVQ